MTWEQAARKYYRYALKADKARGHTKLFLIEKRDEYEALTFRLFREAWAPVRLNANGD